MEGMIKFALLYEYNYDYNVITLFAHSLCTWALTFTTCQIGIVCMAYRQELDSDK